jgi:hypothetical protein
MRSLSRNDEEGYGNITKKLNGRVFDRPAPGWQFVTKLTGSLQQGRSQRSYGRNGGG